MNHQPYNVIEPWINVVRQSFDGLSKPQAKGLAFFSLGMAWARSCNLLKVAEKLSFLGLLPAVEQRLQRFLSNPAIDWKRGAMCLTDWVFQKLFSCKAWRNKYLVLLVDETSLNEYLKVMCVALAYRGRAIPLAWWCYHQNHYPMGQVELINHLLGLVAPFLPKKAKILVEADRGIGCSPELLQAILRRKWFFLTRVQSEVTLHLSDGREVTFGQMVPRPARLWSQEVLAFKKAGWLRCRALGYWKVGAKEPWLLVTNCPEARIDDYRVRMWEESAFRDLKSNGFNWQQSRVRKPEHANLLWLVMAVAYAWAIGLGTQALSKPSLWRQVARGNNSRTSVFQVGLRLLNRVFFAGVHCSDLREPKLNPIFYEQKSVV